MSQPIARAEVWAAGDTYEPYVGRWSRLVAREFLSWLDAPRGKDWVDVGCGTGALTQAILDAARPRSVLGVDASAAFVEYAKTHVRMPDVSFRLAAKATVTYRVADAQTLPLADKSVDAGVSGLALNFVPEPGRAAAELARVVRSGGLVAAYVWDYAGKMEMMRYFWDAAVALDPGAVQEDEGRRFPMCAPDPLTKLFTGAGLKDVQVRALDVVSQFRDFDDYWSPFLGGQGPAPTYVASLERDRREALRESLRDTLPVKRDGTIRLTARAWAVRGRSA